MYVSYRLREINDFDLIFDFFELDPVCMFHEYIFQAGVQ